MREYIQTHLNAHKELLEAVVAENIGDIEDMAELALLTYKKGRKILLFGNGGSAADAQHIAAELTGRFEKNRGALGAIALHCDTSAMTAIANDFGYRHVYARQVEALGRKGDLCIGISTSGNSENIIEALVSARTIGCSCIGLLGGDGGRIKDMVDIPLIVPSRTTARVQEMHILVGHILCSIIERELFG